MRRESGLLKDIRFGELFSAGDGTTGHLLVVLKVMFLMTIHSS